VEETDGGSPVETDWDKACGRASVSGGAEQGTTYKQCCVGDGGLAASSLKRFFTTLRPH